jgi:hypothetical protein
VKHKGRKKKEEEVKAQEQKLSSLKHTHGHKPLSSLLKQKNSKS